MKVQKDKTEEWFFNMNDNDKLIWKKQNKFKGKVKMLVLKLI